MTDRKRLVFFASADPRTNPRPIWSAYHFAEVATRAGLEAEVRLAGDAVRVAREDGVMASPLGDEVREKTRVGARGAYAVSL